MRKDRTVAAIAVNVIKTPILRNVLIGCFAISILLPTYSTVYILPLFVKQLLKTIEDQAYRTASHLASCFTAHPDVPIKYLITPELIASINGAMHDFDIERIKIFSKSGEVLYSTHLPDIATINQHAYFHTIVASGNMFSKIIQKGYPTMGGRIVDRDVAEVYIPIMRQAIFQGAFEIYYNITDSKRKLDTLLLQSSHILYTIAVALLLFLLVTLFQASKTRLNLLNAEKKLEILNMELQERVDEQTHEIQATQETSIEALAILAEYYDADTGGHLSRIQGYTVLLLTWMKDNLPYGEYISSKPEYIEETSLASILHDIGKTAIPKTILTKPGKLTVEEYQIMQKHTLIAADVMDKANKKFTKHFKKDSYLALARDIALYHHEKWNGTGYPEGLKGEDIPLTARVVALADAYEAMRSKRSYKAAYSHEYAVEEIIRERGEHFDPSVVDAFLAQADKFLKYHQN